MAISILILFTLTFGNVRSETENGDPAEIILSYEGRDVFFQYDMARISLEFNSTLPPENITVLFNSNRSLNGYPSMQDQLPYHFLNRSVNWDFSVNRTALFWMDLTDQFIWMTDEGMSDRIPLTLVFTAYHGGYLDSEVVDILLINVNDPPPRPETLRWEPEVPVVGGSVALEADPVVDPDLDNISYIWDLGDGNLARGRIVTHVYESAGSYTVSIWVQDSEFRSKPIEAEITVRERPKDEDREEEPEKNQTETDDEDGDTEEEEKTSGPPWIFAIYLVGAIFILLLLSLFIMILKSKKGKRKEKKRDEPSRMLLDVVHGPSTGKKEELRSRLGVVKSSMKKRSR